MEIRNTTTLEELLVQSPELEENLADLLPGYDDVKNEALRAGIRKILTIERIAIINQTDVFALVKQLQEKTGRLLAEEATAAIEFADSDPEWIKEKPLEIVDGVEMLNRGEHPVGTIGQKMQAANNGDFLLLKTNFHPQPLVEAMQQEGYRVFSRSELNNEKLFLTFILKESADS